MEGYLQEAAHLLTQTNLPLSHSILPLFPPDNGLSAGHLKRGGGGGGGVTADLRGDIRERLSVEKDVDKSSRNQDDPKRDPSTFVLSPDSMSLN